MRKPLPGNEEATLRWNACVRFIQREEQLESRASDVKMTFEASHGDEMPLANARSRGRISRVCVSPFYRRRLHSAQLESAEGEEIHAGRL